MSSLPALVRRALLVAVPVVLLAAPSGASAGSMTVRPDPATPSAITRQGVLDDLVRTLQRLTFRVTVRGTKLIRSNEVKTARRYLSTGRKTRKQVVRYWCDQWLSYFDRGRQSKPAAVRSWVAWTYLDRSANTAYWSCKRLFYLPLVLYS